MINMQNIDPIYLLQPIIVIIIVVSLILYWYYKKSFTVLVLLYSLAAYGIAILIKILFQEFTINIVKNLNRLYILGLYYGLQTMILEVGFAYLFAEYAISKQHMSEKDASGYGIGLAFWENGVLLGIVSLMNLIVLYLLLASGGQMASQTYNELMTAHPALFHSVTQALPVVGLGIIERISSIMVHLAWGFLTFNAAFYKKKKYLLLALPMGLIDFFVPFASSLGIVIFEALIFIIAVICLLVALKVNMDLKKSNNEHLP